MHKIKKYISLSLAIVLCFLAVQFDSAKRTIAAIPSACTISGTVNYYDGAKTVSNAAVILENDLGIQLESTVTDINGYYEFTNLADGGDYLVRVEKDDNDASNGVNGLDLTKIVRHMVGFETFGAIFKIISSDVDETGTTNGLDLTKITRYIVGLDSSLPSGGWKFYSSVAAPTENDYLAGGTERIYTGLSGDMANQDFTGIKMGDADNSWTDGALNFQTGGNNSAIWHFGTSDDIMPGDYGEEEETISNIGSANGHLAIAFENLINDENGCAEPEYASEPNCDNDNIGELAENLDILAYLDENGNGTFDSGTDSLAYEGKAIGIFAGSLSDYLLPAGESVDFRVEWNFSPEAGNEVQSDRARITITFDFI